MAAAPIPQFQLPPHLAARPLDILAVGSLLLEQVVRIAAWPKAGGQDNIRADRVSTSAGGCATNVTCYGARLGGKTAPLGALADGAFGHDVFIELERSRVDTRYLKRVPGHDGSLIIILSGPDGGWATLDHTDPAVVLTAADVPPVTAFETTKFTHIDGYSFLTAGDEASVEAALDRAKTARTLISIDSSVPGATTRTAFTRMLFTAADIVFANREEALAITGAATLDAAIAALRTLGPQVAIIKLGDGGSVIVTPSGTAEVPAFSVPVVDTISAGDAYVAATLVGLCSGLPLLDAATRGSAAGALACGGAGSLARRFNAADIDALIACS